MKQERLWYHNDITGPQRAALLALRDETATGSAYAGNVAKRATLRALHRYGLVTADQGDVIQKNTIVTITQSGLESISNLGRSGCAEKL